jgi:uncharacterized NAD-dependent epimerase/dehydratase family protein
LSAERRYLVLAEGHSDDAHHGKTMRGFIRYAPYPTVAILDSQRAGESYEGIPIVASVQDALGLAPTTALIGVAPTGGTLPPVWRDIIDACVGSGLDVESGMHTYLSDDAELVERARRHGVELRDLRRPPEGIGVPTGANLTAPALIVHTVGSDCAIGKKTMAIELHAEAQRRGLASVFVPTGQTGIAISGWGIAVDAVIADFVAGAAERLVVEGAARGELLWVEGQGSLVHPFYSGVTLGLYHGCVPHVLVLCHRAGDAHLEGLPEHPIPPLGELVELYERVALPARPATVACIALNTVKLGAEEGRAAIEAAHRETGLPVDDPVRFGAAGLVDAALAAASSLGVWPRSPRG